MVSDNKKNPSLGPLQEGYNMEYISPFKYFLEYRGILGLAFETKEEIEKMN
jgi:hypothetical protein